VCTEAVLYRPVEVSSRLLPLSNYSYSCDPAVAFGLFSVALFPRPMNCQEKGKNGFATWGSHV